MPRLPHGRKISCWCLPPFLGTSEQKKPRGKRGQGCVYLPKGSRNWWYKFSINGRTVQQSAETESRREALDKLKDAILKHASGEAVPDGKVTVDHLYDALLADY